MENKNTIKNNLANLLKVKSLVTLIMTGCMVGLLFGALQPPQEALALFCTSYGSIMTYFFSKKDTSIT